MGFEDVTMLTKFYHLEDSSSFQAKFDSHMKKLKAEFKQLGNPKELYQTKEAKEYKCTFLLRSGTVNQFFSHKALKHTLVCQNTSECFFETNLT